MPGNRLGEKNVSKESILKFCETGMNEYTTLIFQAFYSSDWALLEDTSIKYESECYSLGAIEIVGKLIKLRLQLQEQPVDRNLIERTLNGILENSSKVQEFLINHLRSSEYPIVMSRMNIVGKPTNPVDNDRREWFYSNCSLQ